MSDETHSDNRRFQFVDKYITMQGAKATLLNQTIQFTHPKDLNDPFDCLPARPRIEEVKANLEKKTGCLASPDAIAHCLDQREPGHYLKMREKFTIAMSCFSVSKDNHLMWAHYADSFKGCCLEFDSQKLLKSLCLDKFYPVNYSDDRAPEPASLNENIEGVRKILLWKAPCWAYENERRLFINTEKDRFEYTLNGRWYRRFSSDALVSVTVGMNATDTDIDDIVGLCEKSFQHTCVYRTSPDHTRFAYRATQCFPRGGRGV